MNLACVLHPTFAPFEIAPACSKFKRSQWPFHQSIFNYLYQSFTQGSPDLSICVRAPNNIFHCFGPDLHLSSCPSNHIIKHRRKIVLLKRPVYISVYGLQQFLVISLTVLVCALLGNKVVICGCCYFDADRAYFWQRNMRVPRFLFQLVLLLTVPALMAK